MSNRIDQLFRDTLSEHKVPPSAEAWMKIQSGLSKKNKLIIVWRTAAVFVLFGALAGAGYFLINDESSKPDELVKITKLVGPVNTEVEKQLESMPATSKPNITQTKKSDNSKKRKTNHETEKQPHPSSTENIAMDNSELSKQVEERTIVTEPVLIAQSSQSEKPIVIEFTLESFTKDQRVATAHANEQEYSGLKKILETARDVKNGDSDLGNIRDAKNQLFALDFRKDKTKRN